MCKLQGTSRGFEEGRCPLSLGDEDITHILLKCSKASKWREEPICMSSKLLNMNEDIAYCKALTCTKVMEVSIGKGLFKTRCKLEV
jgi:hypothetical protein